MSLFLAAFNDGRPEIFHTLQGEGPTAGTPAVFIRASRCNLHCVWCDSPYTWNFTGTPWPHLKDNAADPAKFDQPAVTCEIDPHDAARKILAYRCPRVVITGGEPLLQQPALLTMIEAIRRERPDCQFEVETNATRIPGPDFAAAINQFNVSPKLANSGMPESLRIQAAALEFFAAVPDAWFKFVVSQPGDLDEIELVRERFAIRRSRILLMPEGRNAADLDRNAPWLAAICRDLGVRFCDRLHIRLWGERRGV